MDLRGQEKFRGKMVMERGQRGEQGRKLAVGKRNDKEEIWKNVKKEEKARTNQDEIQGARKTAPWA